MVLTNASILISQYENISGKYNPVELSTQNIFYNCVDFNVIHYLIQDDYCICRVWSKWVYARRHRSQIHREESTATGEYYNGVTNKNKVFVCILAIYNMF